MNDALSWLECKLKIWRKNTKLICRKGYFVLCFCNHFIIIITNGKMFLAVKRSQRSSSNAFVTVKNAIQGHNMQARSKRPRYQETALHGF